MRIPITIALVTCLTSNAFAEADNAKNAKALFAAISRGPEAVKPLVRFPFSVIGMTFASGACAARFRNANVSEEDLAPFLACVKPLRLALDDENFLVDPGFTLYPEFENGVLYKIYGGDTIREDRAARNLVATANVAPDADGKAAVAAKKVPFLAVDIDLCVAADGTVETAKIERYNVAEAGPWAELILAKVKDAKYKPFTLKGTAIRACTYQFFVYPASKRDAGIIELARLEEEDAMDAQGVRGGVAGGWLNGKLTPPVVAPPPPASQSVPPTLLEGFRIAGNKAIVPDDVTRAKIRDSRKDKVIGSFKLCIDELGAVRSVDTLKATGYPEYDAKITREMRAWKYRPYVVNGNAVRVCTAVTFIYSQK